MKGDTMPTRTHNTHRLIGPAGVGWSYGAVLEVLLSRLDLTEAVIASAYLTTDGAEHLLASINGRSPAKRRPEVTLLIGTKDHFTRKAAIQRLLPFAHGGVRAKGCGVRLNVLCPRDEAFHVKAVYAQRRSGERAVLGSHNLTGSGMDSAGELGIILWGAKAKAIGDALSNWIDDSVPWSRVIKTYREARLTRGRGSDRAAARRAATLSEFEIADDFEATEPMSPVELRAWNEGISTFNAVAPGLSRRASEYLFVNSPRESVVGEQGYYRGALFSYSSDYDRAEDRDSWRLGRRRAVMRVLGTVPVRRNKACVVVAQRVRAFKVTPEIRSVAASLGLTEGDSVRALGPFLAFLITGRPPVARPVGG
jgi:hypothetical protein